MLVRPCLCPVETKVATRLLFVLECRVFVERALAAKEGKGVLAAAAGSEKRKKKIKEGKERGKEKKRKGKESRLVVLPFSLKVPWA